MENYEDPLRGGGVQALKTDKCCLCGGPIQGLGNNPDPVASHPGRCCDKCNAEQVIPARLARHND